jgi:UDP-N-acetylmuramate--alanine ligase
MNAHDMNGRGLHFIAIGGAGMSGLALVAHRRGASVTGSDRAESSYTARLRAAGLEPRIGHDASRVPAGADVVISTAIPPDNPELVVARERGQRVLHRGELLAELCAAGRLIAVAGTHGKTTTTGMLVWAMRSIGEDPTFFIGGELPGVADDGGPANAGSGVGEWVIAEADESDASFLSLRPEIAVVTNVELDHHARWSSRAELEAAFSRFCDPAKGVVLGPGVEVGVPDAVERFDEGVPGPGELALAVPGRHNVLNARAALAAVGLAGLDQDAAAAGLGDFPGMLRRQELRGERSGARIYDDYAHHPTEVRATLEALRELEPERLIAIFQPHLYSRTRALADEFGAALAAADEIGVLDVYAAREEPVAENAGVSGLDVARAAAQRAAGRPVMWLRDLETARAVLAPRLRGGDLLVTIGAGDVYRLAEDLVG